MSYLSGMRPGEVANLRRGCRAECHDRVIVLDQGTVREQGSFDELVAADGSLLGELYALAQDR